MRRRWRGWRPPLRLAWRDALRARGRSVLVLVMIALPVLAVTAADVAHADRRRLRRRGARPAARRAPRRGSVTDGPRRVIQAPDPDDGCGQRPATARTPRPALADDVGARSGVTSAAVTESRAGELAVRDRRGRSRRARPPRSTCATRSPTGSSRSTSGRLPAAARRGRRQRRAGRAGLRGSATRSRSRTARPAASSASADVHVVPRPPGRGRPRSATLGLTTSTDAPADLARRPAAR